MPIYFVDNSVFKIVIWECNQRFYGWEFCFTVICQVSLCKTICDDKPYDLPPNGAIFLYRFWLLRACVNEPILVTQRMLPID